jgi:hypothetical protein
MAPAVRVGLLPHTEAAFDGSEFKACWEMLDTLGGYTEDTPTEDVMKRFAEAYERYP